MAANVMKESKMRILWYLLKQMYVPCHCNMFVWY